jgi:hypothetical protein
MISIALLLAHNVDAEGVDGYWFLSLKEPDKVNFIGGFLYGYNVGNVYGKEKATAKLLPHSKGKSSKELRKEIKKRTDLDLLKKSITKSPTSLSRELVSFYEQYPLCKKELLADIFLGLAAVWDEDDLLKHTYKQVGETCLEHL